jgi:hypothetical protein
MSASGTDCIVNSLARQAGLTCTAIIPFPADEYCNGSRRRTFFGKASGQRPSDLSCRVNALPLTSLNENASQMIVDHSDLILAIWDGLPSRGAGGTAATVRYAVLRSRPVLLVSPREDDPVEVLWPTPSRSSFDGNDPRHMNVSRSKFYLRFCGTFLRPSCIVATEESWEAGL